MEIRIWASIPYWYRPSMTVIFPYNYWITQQQLEQMNKYQWFYLPETVLNNSLTI